MASEIERIQQIAEIAFGSAEAKLRDIDLQETELRAQIKDLRDRRTTKVEVTHALVGEADLLWRQWIGSRIEELNLALATLLAKKEHAKARLRKAYKKKEGLNLLSDAELKRSQLVRTRRDSYES